MRLHFFMPMSSRHRKLGKILSLLGPTWRSSPVRRILQSICLIVFIVFFLYVCWPYGSSEYGEFFEAKEIIEAEIFLVLDPLVSISTAIAARMWIWSLWYALAVLVVCIVLPRSFCAYVCPLGTLLDLFDWAVTGRALKSRDNRYRSLANTRYYVLAAVLAAAGLGVMLSGFVSAIAVITRAMLFVAGSVQMGLLKGWYLVPPMNAGHWISIGMFIVLISLNFLERRFWCKYLCPTGAVFSVTNLFRLTERKVRSRCVECGKCEEVCSFGAIKSDYTTRDLNCSFCQSCAGVCPVDAIEFTGRWNREESKARGEIGKSILLSRRNVIAGIGTVAVGAGLPVAVCKVAGNSKVVVRPPGTVPEEEFLQLCIRCGQCIKVCPNNVLQPIGLEHGFDLLWTPKVTPDWSGCEPSCNNCGQVCPSGAIRALDLPEKQAARIGLAEVNKKTCLPYVGKGQCRLCVDECKAAGYDAIEFVRVGGEAADNGEPIESSGVLAPVVLEDKCVGCGLCQMRCMAINVKDTHLLDEAAIQVVAGHGKEDRILKGSYIELRDRRRKDSKPSGQEPQGAGDDYLPDFLK